MVIGSFYSISICRWGIFFYLNFLHFGIYIKKTFLILHWELKLVTVHKLWHSLLLWEPLIEHEISEKQLWQFSRLEDQQILDPSLNNKLLFFLLIWRAAITMKGINCPFCLFLLGSILLCQLLINPFYIDDMPIDKRITQSFFFNDFPELSSRCGSWRKEWLHPNLLHYPWIQGSQFNTFK